MESTRSLITKDKLEKLLSELGDADYRRAYVEAHAKDTIAFQLRRMRLANDWEQKDVAAELGNPKLQPMISRYENPDYGKYSVTTLLELAKAFDVALVVRFVKYSELLRWDLHKTEATLQPVPYRQDVELTAMKSETWMWRMEERTTGSNFRMGGRTGFKVELIDAGSPTVTEKQMIHGNTKAA